MRLVALLALAVVGCGGPATPAGPTTTVTPHGTATVFDEPAGPDDGAAAMDVVLTAADGVPLAATYVAGPPDSRQAVVLLHQLSSTRAEWAPVVAALAGRHHVLTLDMRGHGESARRGDGTPMRWQDFSPGDWADGLLDLEAARAFLDTLGILTADSVYVGSSIGSTQALRFVGKYFDAAGVVALSPGLRYRGLDVMPAAKQYVGPMLLVASGEANPAEAADLLATARGKLTPPAPTQVHVAPGTAHGLKMAADDPGLVPALVAFIDAALAAAAAAP